MYIDHIINIPLDISTFQSRFCAQNLTIKHCHLFLLFTIALLYTIGDEQENKLRFFERIQKQRCLIPRLSFANHNHVHSVTRGNENDNRLTLTVLEATVQANCQEAVKSKSALPNRKHLL